MNKTKKIVTAVVATVMAGTMVASFTACNPDGPENNKPNIGSGKDIYGIIDKETGFINYDAYKRDSEVEIGVAIGHNKTYLSTSFKGLGQTITLPDGKNYKDDDFKPVFVQMGNDLNIKWKDTYGGESTSNNLGWLTDAANIATRYNVTDIFTSDLSKVVDAMDKGTADVLNLANYLDYMPHFKAFLENNPVVYLSLLQDGMDTETGEDKTIYVAPYFDGYNDIERYCLMRHDMVEKLLNGNAELSDNGTAFGKASSVKSYMGTTGSYSIESLNEAGTGKVTIKKDYDKVLDEVKKSGTALYAAYNAIDPAGYTGNSGNIVDIQSAAIDANNNVTGKQLVNLLRAYIDVCYNGYYTADKRANLFIGYDAAWDVDDMVALLRCVVTNAANLGADAVVGISPRNRERDRTIDLSRLAGQLYGVRGTASTLEFTYIDNAGNLQDARADKAYYEAHANLNLMFQEGLIANFEVAGYDGASAIVNTPSAEAFMMYDYSQTQTKNDFYAEDATISGAPTAMANKDDFNFAAVMTPVSKWDVNGDGNIDPANEIFRFTESWRSTKTSGLAVNGKVKDDQAKLDAVLQFIDYLYSEDGQITSTFGPMADAEGNGGFWYGTKATDKEISEGKYFNYKGEKYSGYEYKGKITPKATQQLQNSFRGKEVNGWKLNGASQITSSQLSYTDYARVLMGATLPMGVKNQSLENQLTATRGEAGASKVATALAQGTVKGMTLELDENNYWYTCVPTGLPVADIDQSDIIGNALQANFKTLFGDNSDKKYLPIYAWIMLHGTNTTFDQKEVQVAYTDIDTLMNATILTNGNVTQSVKQVAELREGAHNRAWSTAKAYWDYLKDHVND
ncbi:MAG: hypothetical protein K2N30_00885 [Clostridia bacterium]|nr:hypothetical protein [Clostridia bacterium]